MASHDERATHADSASNGTWLEVLAAFRVSG